jgi:hypothetical protein
LGIDEYNRAGVSQPPALLMAVSGLLLTMAACVLVFLSFWYFELVLWGALGPFAIASLNLGLRIWRLSAATTRGVVYWAISVVWSLTVVLVSFKEVTMTGGLIAATIAAGVIWFIYASVQRSIASA